MAKGNHHDEVLAKLGKGVRGDRKSKFDLKTYLVTGYDVLGLSAPRQRAIFRRGYSFDIDSFDQRLLAWDSIIKSTRSHEVITQAIFFVEKHFKVIEPLNLWNVVCEWVRVVDNWAHSDGLSDIYAKLLEEKPKVILPVLEKWNQSGNPWERRQSIVSLFYYYRKRDAILPFNKVIRLIKNLLRDEHYYVQKGVGWALRECGNAYRTETTDFLFRNYKSISAIAFTAAIEKLPAHVKEDLKILRRAGRG